MFHPNELFNSTFRFILKLFFESYFALQQIYGCAGFIPAIAPLDQGSFGLL